MKVMLYDIFPVSLSLHSTFTVQSPISRNRGNRHRLTYDKHSTLYTAKGFLLGITHILILHSINYQEAFDLLIFNIWEVIWRPFIHLIVGWWCLLCFKCTLLGRGESCSSLKATHALHYPAHAVNCMEAFVLYLERWRASATLSRFLSVLRGWGLILILLSSALIRTDYTLRTVKLVKCKTSGRTKFCGKPDTCNSLQCFSDNGSQSEQWENCSKNVTLINKINGTVLKRAKP